MHAHHTPTGGVVVIIPLGDFGRREQKSFVRVSHSGEQAEFLAKLDRLGAPPGAQLVKNTAGMGLDGVLAHKKLLGNFTVAHALSDQFKDFEFTGGDAELLPFLLVRDEWRSGRDRDFPHDDIILPSRQFKAKPDAQQGKDCGDETAIDFDGMFDYQESVLGPLQQGDQDPADYPEDQNVALHRGYEERIHAKVIPVWTSTARAASRSITQ